MKFGIYGVGGYGREVIPLFSQKTGADQDIVFIDDNPEYSGTTVNGILVISFADLCLEPGRSRQLVIAVSDAHIRKKIAAKCLQYGFSFTTVVAENALINPGNSIGEGGIFSAFTTVTGNATIGEHFHCNIYSFVAHDCVIGDFVTFAPRVSCNGNVHVEDFAYIGTGAVIRQWLPDKPLIIGKGALVGMGSVVTADVPPGVLVVGNPARYVRDLPIPD